MEKRPQLEDADFLGKTVVACDTSAVNVLKLEFDDGSVLIMDVVCIDPRCGLYGLLPTRDRVKGKGL